MCRMRRLQTRMPDGCNMAKMKVEFYHYNQRHGVSLQDKLVTTFRDTPL